MTNHTINGGRHQRIVNWAEMHVPAPRPILPGMEEIEPQERATPQQQSVVSRLLERFRGKPKDV